MRLGTSVRAAAVTISATALVSGWTTPALATAPAATAAPVAAVAPTATPAAGVEQYDQFIVGFKPGSATAKSAAARLNVVRAVAQQRGLGMTEVRRLATGAHLFRADSRVGGSAAQSLLAALAAGQDVAYVEPDARFYPDYTPNDTQYANQWHYKEATAGLNLPTAWDSATGSGVTVAVIDTGKTSHSDLNTNLVAGYDFISDSANARDGGGRDSNPQDEGDWNDTDGECSLTSTKHNSSWHGTHVAGTIAALSNNSKGVAGVAFGAKVQPLRVLGKCGGSLSDIADAIVWASGGTVSGVPANSTPAKVINMSLGGSGSCGTTYQTAINTAVDNGTVVVVAAGNSNTSASLSRPANCNNVVAVAALDRAGNRAFYSNYGTTVDVAAPGGETGTTASDGVLSTLNTGTTTPGSETYAYYQGTSMATPHVAGVAALMLSKRSLTPAELESTLKVSTRAIPGTCSEGCGAGLVDAAASVKSLSQALQNPGFESGNVKWNASFGVITNSTLRAAHTGTWKAWLNGTGSLSTETLSQSVTIPSSATSATFKFWLRIDTAESGGTAYDKLKVQVISSTGTVLTTLATYSNVNAGASYVERSFNLTSYKGSTVTLKFTGTEDSSLQTSFVIDDTALNIA